MFVKYGIDKLLKERQLWSTLTQVFPYNKNVVRRLYANLTSSYVDPESSRSGKVFVHSRVYTFNLEVINDLFSMLNIDIPNWVMDGSIEKALVSELTGGRLKKWAEEFQSTKLTWQID